ncbi:MAG: hypothetical protein AAGF11_50950 [Myxococcota bacterium]
MEHYPHAFQSMRAALVQAWIDSDRGVLDTAQTHFESLEQAIPNPYESAWATVGRVVTATRAGDPPVPHVTAIEHARQTLGAFPLSYRYELAVVDEWLEHHADTLRTASTPRP